MRFIPFKIFSLILLTFTIKAQDLSLKYSKTITEEDLKKQLSIIASDEMEGRETSTPGQYKAARFLANEFEKLGLKKIVPLYQYMSYFQWFDVYKTGKKQQLSLNANESSENYVQAASMNVAGMIIGKSIPEEFIVISAHYDHIGIDSNGDINNGADDDGSGTAAVLEIAEAFVQAQKDGNGPERSILFLLVAGEEKGLLGSKYFTNVNPLIPLEKIVCDLNIDMIGRKDNKHETEEYLYLIGADKLSKELDNMSNTANKKYLNYEIDYTYNNMDDPNRFYYRSDHYNFAQKGIPIIFFFTGVHEDYHRPTDDVEKILFPKYCKITKYIFHIAWDVANLKHRIKLNK